MLPGGYTFTHILFWTVVALVAVGTNVIPILLSVGVAFMVLEAIRGR